MVNDEHSDSSKVINTIMLLAMGAIGYIRDSTANQVGEDAFALETQMAATTMKAGQKPTTSAVGERL